MEQANDSIQHVYRSFMPRIEPMCDVRSLESDAVASAVDLANLLRGMAWLGVVSTAQVQRLWLPQRSTERARVLLHRMQRLGLVESHRWYIPRRNLVLRRGEHRMHPAPPRCAGLWWTPTKKGLELASVLVGEPVRSLGLRAPQLLAHDRLVVETLIRMIELARPVGLSGVYLEREALLNPPAAKPRMDAVIVVRLHPDQCHIMEGVPWTTNASLPGEVSQRFGLEIDNATEGMNEIAVKALAYRQAARAPWAQQPGAFPVPVWVVPHASRQDRIQTIWQQAWPEGTWLITTEADMRQDRWLEYANGSVRECRLFCT